MQSLTTPLLLAILAVSCLPLFSGCKSVVYGSAITSVVVANELIRYTIPELGNIDRIEVTEYKSIDIDRKSLAYYDALNLSQKPYSSILDEPVVLWFDPVRPAVLKTQQFPKTHGGRTTKIKVITDPRAVLEFAGFINENRTLWLKHIEFVPASPYVHSHFYNIAFYSQNVFVRTIGFSNSELSTTHESMSVIRRLSGTDTFTFKRLLSSYMDESGGK